MSAFASNPRPAPPANPSGSRKESKPGFLTYLVALLLTVAVLIPIAAYFGWAISVVWGWFVVPLGVPSLGVWEAAGIFALTKFLTQDTRDLTTVEGRTTKEKATRLLGILLGPILLVGVAGLYHLLAG